MKQPRALYLLNFVSMWECFSYYGMRVLLVLYMTSTLGFNDTNAFCLYALYTTLVELGGILGGVVADRYLGLKRSITIGGWTIALGHIALALNGFYIGLGLIIAGTCLFRSNVAAFLGSFYSEHDPRREAGYTIYYTGINIGGFLAAILCGVAAETYGWHAGFGLAAIGMLAGNIALICGKKLLVTEAKVPSVKSTLVSIPCLVLGALLAAFALTCTEIVSYFIPFVAACFLVYAVRQVKGKQLLVYIAALVLFYACEEQLGSSLVLFAERYVNKETLFGSIPAASLITFNPLTILIAGPLLSRLFQRYTISDRVKIQGSFLLLGASFLLLYASCHFLDASGMSSLWFAIMSIVLIALGEILIGPTVYAAAAKAAPKALQGVTMGMVTLGFALANLFSGTLSQMMAVTEQDASISVYASGFVTIGALALLIAFVFQYRRKVPVT